MPIVIKNFVRQTHQSVAALLLARPKRTLANDRTGVALGVRFAFICFLLFFGVTLPLPNDCIADEGGAVYSVGVAKRDITPTYPVRLNGFGFRREESEGITQPVWAKALAIGGDDEQPIVLITLDSLGIRQSMVDEVARRLKKRSGIQRNRVAVTFSHSHTTPKVVGTCDTIFSSPIPPEHQAHIDKYTAELIDAMEAVALAAMANRQPSTLSWAVGRVHFATNRRPQGGPVDQSLPVLVVKSASDDSIRAIYTTYACHCVTLSNNKVSGDWAGFAQRVIESRNPGTIALTSIGCGSDANPDSGVTLDNTAAATDQGTQIADEVDRLLRGPLKEIAGPISAQLECIDLPLNPPPSAESLEKLAESDDPAGYNAKFQLAKLKQGEQLQTQINYPIQVLEFGDSLAMIFLAGEVCADYSVRLKKELDADRIWLHGYSNDFCAYIPSERLLKEGGYGGGAEVVYFALPNTLASGLEDRIVESVIKTISDGYRVKATASSTDAQPWPLEKAIASIHTKPGLLVEPVATEPLVADPVAIDFAPDGRMWVAEMPDYSRYPGEEFSPSGNIRRLTDVDRDGKYDQVELYADGFRFPTDVKSWRTGVIVCDAPDVIYLEDTDGDGRADVRHVLLTGFETHNAQARVNSLRWGLDGWLYGSCGLFGGKIRTASGEVVSLGQRDFRFQPDTGKLEPVAGRTQQGRARNDWGDWFGCENESLLDHYPMVDIYLRRNPRLKPPPPEKSVPQQNAVALHPIGPPTLFKFSGPPGRPTSVCGLDFYRDDLLGSEYTNNAFLAEPVNQLVHRLILSPNGATFTGSVADDERNVEFLASSDPWFRPVQIRTGADGCLYVVDMHRAVIEHKKFIPQETLRDLDVTAGREQGRIYRIRPQASPPRPIDDLTQLTAAQLVPLLDTPNGPRRDQVHELIVQRNDKSVVPQLQKLVQNNPRATTRLHALCALDALAGIDPDLLTIALRDDNSAVRQNAIRLSESWLASRQPLGMELLKLINDPDSRVRQQLACTLGEWDDLHVGPALAEIFLANDTSPYVRAGVLSSVNARNVTAFLSAILKDRDVRDIPATVLEPAVRMAVELGATDHSSVICRALAIGDAAEYQVWQLDVARQLLRDARGEPSVAECVAPLVAFAQRTVEGGVRDDALTHASLRLVAAATPDDDLAALLAPYLVPQSAPSVQRTAVELAFATSDSKAVDTIVFAWPGLAKGARDRAFESIVARQRHAIRFLELLGSGELAANSLDAFQRQQLLHHTDAAVRTQATTAFSSSINADREKIVNQYLPQMNGKGNSALGKQLFAKHCSSCHLLEGTGHSVGPDLAALSARTTQGLVESILDPNQAVDDRYRCYTALTNDGLTYYGILADETSNSVTLVEQQARQRVLLRTDLDSLSMSELSLMPEGLERELSPSELNDLLAYLATLHETVKTIPGNRPQVATVGEDGVVELPASIASISGDEITFEPTWQNIGYWHATTDNVSWEFELPNSGEFDIYLDSACPADSSGNEFLVEGGSRLLVGKVAPTGGYDHYQIGKVGRLSFAGGKNSLLVRPKGRLQTRNLMDLRAVYLAPAGSTPRLPSHASVNRRIDSARAIERLVSDLAVGTPQEYEAIPQLWEIAIAAGRRNDTNELVAILNVSIPRGTAPIADWQIVTLGGGIVNGLSGAGDWPGRRINALLQQCTVSSRDWDRVLQHCAQLADSPTTRIGTRYDALRLLVGADWKLAEQVISKYLAPDVEQEMQVGAIQTLADYQSAAADQMLVSAVTRLDGDFRRQAVQGLLRTGPRTALLAAAVADGRIAKETLTDAELGKLNPTTKTHEIENAIANTPAFSLGSMFGEHMVLQRDMRVPIWGYAPPGASVQVTIAAQTSEATADLNGRWRVNLSPLAAGGPFELRAVAGGDSIVLHDVLVGDVWFAGGQSNMEWPVRDVVNADDEIAQADWPLIRRINVPNASADVPQEAFASAPWQACRPDTVGDFSGVAYFFARHIHRELDIPIGIVQCDWGATMMEAWTDPQVLAASPPFDDDEATMRERIANLPANSSVGSLPKNIPGVLYNAMVAPVIPYAIRGVIWYQGENNAALHSEYLALSKLMIANWRNAWGQGDFPFLLVQLAGWEPGKDTWPCLREAQRLTAEQVPNVDMAVAIDLGDRTDIHPRNKQEVGRRLGMLAMTKVYGKAEVFSGPAIRSIAVDGGRLRLSFRYADIGLIAEGGELRGFEIADANGNFQAARATIDGGDVLVWAEQVATPTKVRYDWRAYPDGNLRNAARLPATPFQAVVGQQ